MGPDGPASPSSTSQRRLRLVLVYGVVLLPVVIWHAMQAVQTTANSPLDWAPSNFPARVDYDAFSRTFGPGDVVVLSWKGCTTDATELDTLVEALRTDSAFFDEGTWLFDQVACGRELIQQMLALGIDRTEAVQRLHHTMIGPDGATTCVVIGFTKQALLQRSRLVPRIQEVTEQHCHVAASDQHLAGPVIDGLAADLASAATLQKLALPSSVVVFLVGLCCLGSWRSTLVVFGISLYCQAATLSLISICGDTASALLIVLPPLIQVLALAAGIHLVNYFGNAESGATAAEAARQAFRIGWLPCVLSAGTTAIGMASLMVSDLTPIRSFGAYSTVGLLLTTSLVLALVPTALAILGFTVSSKHSTTRRAPRTLTDRNTHWQPLFVLVTRHHVAIVLLFLTSMGALGWSMSRLETSVRIETLFAPQSRILSDYRWLEDNLSPLVPIEVVLTFDRAAQESVQQRLDHVRRVESILKEHPQVRGTLSAVTFMPVMPDHRPRTREEAMATQQFVANAMSQANSRWVDMRLLSETNGRQQWRIRGLVSALEQTDYGELLSAIRQHLASAATEPGMSLHATGIMPLVHDIQRQLMHDLRSSFLLAFVIITIVMTVMQGSVEGGLVAMLPNDPFTAISILSTLPWTAELLLATLRTSAPVSAEPPTTPSVDRTARVFTVAASSTTEFTPSVISPVFTAPSAVVAMLPKLSVGRVYSIPAIASVVACSVAAVTPEIVLVMLPSIKDE